VVHVSLFLKQSGKKAVVWDETKQNTKTNDIQAGKKRDYFKQRHCLSGLLMKNV